MHESTRRAYETLARLDGLDAELAVRRAMTVEEWCAALPSDPAAIRAWLAAAPPLEAPARPAEPQAPRPALPADERRRFDQWYRRSMTKDQPVPLTRKDVDRRFETMKQGLAEAIAHERKAMRQHVERALTEVTERCKALEQKVAALEHERRQDGQVVTLLGTLAAEIKAEFAALRAERSSAAIERAQWPRAVS